MTKNDGDGNYTVYHMLLKERKWVYKIGVSGYTFTSWTNCSVIPRPIQITYSCVRSQTCSTVTNVISFWTS